MLCCIYWDDNVFLILLIQWATLINCQVLKQPCISGANSTWPWCVILFIYCCIDLLVFVEDFCVYIHKRCWPTVFLWCVCLVFISKQYWPRRMSWEVFPPSGIVLPFFTTQNYVDMYSLCVLITFFNGFIVLHWADVPMLIQPAP